MFGKYVKNLRFKTKVKGKSDTVSLDCEGFNMPSQQSINL